MSGGDCNGGTFNVGDRIVMGGMRRGVIALGLTQTTIMEMGQPPAVQEADPAMWAQSRQYTGRVVSVSNGRIFDEPVDNYTIMLDAAERHGVRAAELGPRRWTRCAAATS